MTSLPTEAEIWARLESLPLEGFSRPVLDVKDTPLRALREQAEAAATSYDPITPTQRFEAFERLGFLPHGLYVPVDPGARAALKARLEEIGAIVGLDERQRQYVALQVETGSWQQEGVPGGWTGQQGVARSTAKFRLVEWGRQSGKTLYASREVLGIALLRPRTRIWCCAPTMRHVSRVFDYIMALIRDLGIKTSVERNSAQEKYIQLADNETVIEGVSLDTPTDSAGATVLFALIDEAAQISEDAWITSVLPPLSSRDGSALLISSPTGGSGFFAEKVAAAKKEARERGTDAEWEYFHAASWDVNFYRFPQGRKSSFMRSAEREMPWRDFLKTFGAIALDDEERIYPEFKEQIHVGDYPFNPEGPPVRLAVDPSGGANPYAVAAIQDYGDYAVIFDEFYQTHVTAEQVVASLDQRSWREATENALLDSGAGPTEVARWNACGIKSFGLQNKPEIKHRLPFLRNMLRDPLRFSILHRRKVDELLAEWGLEPGTDDQLDEDRQKSLAIQVEQSLADNYIEERDLQELADSARLYVNRTCVWTIWEFKNYKAQKRIKTDMNYGPIPRDFANHIMDACGYYAYHYHRGGMASGGQISTILPTAGPLPPIPRPAEGQVEVEQLTDRQRWDRQMVAEWRRRPSTVQGPVFAVMPCR